jgi:hypothetical protein
MSVELTKSFPMNYPDDAVKILDAMSMDSNITLVGSMSLRSQQYAGDYDGFEVVNVFAPSKAQALKKLARMFQKAIVDVKAQEYAYIDDIKAGVVPEWDIMKDVKLNGKTPVNYNASKLRSAVAELRRNDIITATEEKEALTLLKSNLSFGDYELAKEKLKFHIVRWTVPEVQQGSKKLRDGRTFTLEDAFSSPGLTKLDVIALIANNRFTDFSVIYEFHYKGEILNPVPVEIEKSLIESYNAYYHEGNYFKALKRKFALAKFKNQTKVMEKLTTILNSDLGRLYHITGDIDTLVRLMEDQQNPPMNLIRYEIDQFISRLSNIYTLRDYLKDEHDIIGSIRQILKMSPARMKPALEELGNALNKYLQKNTLAMSGDALSGGYIPL